MPTQTPTQATTAPRHTSATELPRVLGLGDLVLFYTIAVVGLRWVPTAATLGAASITLWVICFVFFFLPLSFTVSELSSRYPQEGGIYVWVKQSFGTFNAFLAGWCYWMTNIFVFPAVLLFGASNLVNAIPALSRYGSSKAPLVVLGCLAILIAVTLNVVGLNIGKWLHNVGGLVGTWVTAVILIVVGLVAWMKFGTATAFTLTSLRPKLTGASDVLLLSNLAFAFAGLESASAMGGEVRNPKRNIPRALLLAGAGITFIYVIGTVSLLLALPPASTSQLVGITDAIKIVGNRSAGLAFGTALGLLAALLLFIAELGNLGAWMAAIARLPYVAGTEGLLPRSFSRLHPRWRTPYVALLAGGSGIALLLVGSLAGQRAEQAYRMLINVAVILYFIPYMYMFAALIVVQKETVDRDVIRVPGGRAGAYVAGTVGILVTAVSIVLSFLPAREVDNQLLFVAKIVGSVAVILGLGITVFLFNRRRNERETDHG
jgi:glutamate:GABA antiporter